MHLQLKIGLFITASLLLQGLYPMATATTIAQTTSNLEALQLKLAELSSMLNLLKNQLENLKKEVESMIPPLFNALKIINPIDPTNIADLATGFNQRNYWSFVPNAQQLTLSMHNTNYQLFAQFPLFGNYLGSGYCVSERIALIEMLPSMLNKIPQALQQALGANAKLACFYTAITGPVPDYFAEDDSKDRSYNAVFHGFLLAETSDNRLYYRHDVAMGIFEANGVSQHVEGISFNTLSNIDVHCHDNRMSPDNARFTVTKERVISTFWSAATRGQRTIATYNLFINTGEERDKIRTILEAATSFDDLLSNLQAHAQTLSNTADKEALEGFVTTMQAMRTP